MITQSILQLIAVAIIVRWLWLYTVEEREADRAYWRGKYNLYKAEREREQLREYLITHSVKPQRRTVREIKRATYESVSFTPEGMSLAMRAMEFDTHYEKLVPSITVTVESFKIATAAINKPFTFTYLKRFGVVDIYYEPLQWKRI